MDELVDELTCAICTDILYQPLTLLDCLHTFCGSCLKEWFTWQATSASQSQSQSRRTTSPYTCPSCRESVRGTKVDWRANTLLDGFLKAHPDREKNEQDKEEMRKLYTPGDDVLKPVQRVADNDDMEDERLLAQVRDLSMADADRMAARRSAERTARERRRHDNTRPQQRDASEDTRRRQARLTESRLRQHDYEAPQIEHQPSLRSLLSASDEGSSDIQTEILQSIYAEGVLDGIDLDNLTTEQEEELTDRIAEAYRRRQQQPRERSSNRQRRRGDSRSTQPAITGVESTSRQHAQSDAGASQPLPRSRPPVSRPHVFERNLQEPERDQRRSTSATNQRSPRLAPRSDGMSPASRSATDLSQQPSSQNAQRQRPRGASSTGRSFTDPETGNLREHIQRIRDDSSHARTSSGSHRAEEPVVEPPEAVGSTSLSSSPPTSSAIPQQEVRPAASTAALAPEPTPSAISQSTPSISCNSCSQADIQETLHYNCAVCSDGHYNLCLSCYRNGKGCNYWFGFGFRALDRWYRNAPPEGWPRGNERPHVLSARRYVNPQDHPDGNPQDTPPYLQEGPFCESCFAFANDFYWYCEICLEGAWGFCDQCVHQGNHCTHPLLLIAHIGTLQQPHYDPTKVTFLDHLPHLRPGTYVTLPPTTHCDLCHRPIPPANTRFHCFRCSQGDYDICHECYRGLVAQGKISQSNGPEGWRRCLQGHRMAVIGYDGGGYLRRTVSEPVGGWEGGEAGGAHRLRCLALYSYFPAPGVADELPFPKNAEIREVRDLNGEWFSGVYAGKVNLFPGNHVRVLS